jgi:hypothetical protein
MFYYIIIIFNLKKKVLVALKSAQCNYNINRFKYVNTIKWLHSYQLSITIS